MAELSILSPHRDDAIFSVYLSMARWVEMGMRLRVINFFTRSEYAPRAISAAPLDSSVVSMLRAREDRRAIRSISRAIQVRTLHLFDAPIRLGAKLESICQPESWALRSAGETAMIASRIASYCRRGMLLAPLALGNHVDHLSVLEATLFNRRYAHLAFYEDLPYATWTSEQDIQRRVQSIVEKTRVCLRPAVLRTGPAQLWKRKAASLYQTQITRDEASAIARYSRKHQGAERLWIPQFNRSWTELTA